MENRDGNDCEILLKVTKNKMYFLNEVSFLGTNL